MSGPVLDASHAFLCPHGARAIAVSCNARVLLSGTPILCVDDTVLVQGCPAQPPCVAIRPAGSARISASGRPIASASGAFAEPGGGAAFIVPIQTRVAAG